MRIRRDTGERLRLSGPPGGVGTVVLMLVVGVALSGGGAGFIHVFRNAGQIGGVIAAGLVALVGLAILLWGVGMAITRDRLELDAVTRRGRWTRRTLGRDIAPPVEFDFDGASVVRIQFFVDAAPSGGASVGKVRARLRLRSPRRVLDLDEAEEQREPRVRAIAERVAEMLEIPVESGSRR